jgi:hypothetical protein
MTQSQYSQRKCSTLASLEAYQRLEAETIKARMIGPYASSVDDWLKVKTGDRFYPSKWIEKAISKFLTMNGWMVEKKPDTGQRIDNRKVVENFLGQKSIAGSVTWVKSKRTQAGRADLYLEKRIGNGLRYAEWLEIKAGRDTQKPEQKAFERECIANGECYTIIKTLDEFWVRWDEILSKI